MTALALVDAEFGRLAHDAEDGQALRADVHLEACQAPQAVVIDSVIGC